MSAISQKASFKETCTLWKAMRGARGAIGHFFFEDDQDNVDSVTSSRYLINPRSPKLKIITRSPKGGSFWPPLGFHIYWPIFAFVVSNESLAQKLFNARKNLKKVNFWPSYGNLTDLMPRQPRLSAKLANDRNSFKNRSKCTEML